MVVLLLWLVVVSGCCWCCFGHECWLMMVTADFIGATIGGGGVGGVGGVEQGRKSSSGQGKQVLEAREFDDAPNGAL